MQRLLIFLAIYDILVVKCRYNAINIKYKNTNVLKINFFEKEILDG